MPTAKKVAVIMGSDSDLPVVMPAIQELKRFGIETEARVMSAHRTPELAAQRERRRIWRAFLPRTPLCL